MLKVALITGGASGLGLAVAKSLSSKGWKICIADMNEAAGQAAATSLEGTFFHKTNVTDYASLCSAFEQTFQKHGQLDFVFANAGIVERDNFYARHTEPGPPPIPDMLSIDINLKAVITTSYLAQHYMRLNTHLHHDNNNNKGGGCLIATSSVGGIYPSPFCPMYSAAKHGVLGFTRSIAKHYFLRDGIRVNAIMPGTMRTGLLSEKEWDHFKDQNWTSVDKVVGVVEMLLDEEQALWGKTVEVSGEGHFFREGVPYSTERMRKDMEKTDVEAL